MVRRTEILQSAAALIAVSGLRTSLQDIADAAGIQAGSLYHHFESKEAILVELLRRYHDDLDRIAGQADSRLNDPGTSSAFDRLVDLGSAIAQCAVTHRAALQMTFYEFPSPDPELTAIAQQRPTAILEATLRPCEQPGGAATSARRRPPVLADRFCRPCCTSASTSCGTMPHRPARTPVLPDHAGGPGHGARPTTSSHVWGVPRRRRGDAVGRRRRSRRQSRPYQSDRAGRIRTQGV